MSPQTTCPLCDGADVEFGPVANRDAYVCFCAVCGKYLFTSEAVHALSTTENKPRRFILSSLTRRASDRGNRLELLSTTIPELLAKTPTPKNPHDVLDPLLLAVHDRTIDPVGTVLIPYNDYPLFVVRGVDQFKRYFKLLGDLGLLDIEDDPGGKQMLASLTLDGWNRIDELRRGGRRSRRAFVAMSFAKELDQVYDLAIEPALKAAGWIPVRMDRVQHNERIDDRIVAEIRRSGMVVADFTGNRQGVYFEAGLAAGLGLPVIWTVRESDLAAVHFDTRQYNHIVWTDVESFREALHDRIVASVTAPPLEAP